jgi:hypothetical protein
MVGVDCNKMEWTHIVDYLEHDNLVGGDFKSYDVSMLADVLYAVWGFLIWIAQRSNNYTPEDIKVMWGIATDNIHCMVYYNGDMVMFHGINPSGQALTVFINGLANSLYTRYNYSRWYDVMTFSQYVKLITYGDDNLMGVHSAVPLFNHTNISLNYKNYGITYTMAAKDDESVPYITLKEATFLKRSFIWNEDLKRYLAPLDISSFKKMLHFGKTSQALTERELCCEAICSANLEFYHFGKQEFERRHNQLAKVIADHKLEFLIGNGFKSWDEIVELRTQQS